MKRSAPFNSIWRVAGLLCLMILFSAYAIEYGVPIEPCPLCLLQRYALWGITLCFWLASAWPNNRFWCLSNNALILILSMAGTMIASRHLWIQYLTPSQEIADCLAGLDRVFAYHPFFEALQKIFSARQDCARIDFTILSLPLSAWSLLGFISIIMVNSWIGLQKIKRRI